MPSRAVTTEQEREGLVNLIRHLALPFTCEWQKGRRRSNEQNRLQRRWINEIAEQLGQEPEAVRAYCKLTIGVPILRAENELFCEKYDRIVKPLPYETKLEMMMEPIDFPITRIMTVEQKTKYLDGIARHFAERGVLLSEAA